MIIKLLTEHHLEFLSLKGGCRGSSESTLVKMSNCCSKFLSCMLGRIMLFRDLISCHSQVSDPGPITLFYQSLFKMILYG